MNEAHNRFGLNLFFSEFSPSHHPHKSYVSTQHTDVLCLIQKLVSLGLDN